MVSRVSWKSPKVRREWWGRILPDWEGRIGKAPASPSVAWLDELLSRYSVSIQSMNQWILIRFRGVTALFLFVVTPAPALWGLLAPVWQKHHLLPKEETGMRRQEPGEGTIERGRQGCFFSSSPCVLSCWQQCAFMLLRINRARACMCVRAHVLVSESMGQQWMCRPGTRLVKYQHSVSAAQWNHLFIPLLWDFSIFHSWAAELWSEWRTWWQRQTRAQDEDLKVSESH